MFVFWQIIHKGTQIQMCTHKDTHTQMCELSSTTLCRLSLYIWTFLIQNPFTSGSLSELSKYNNFLRFYPPSNESGKELLLALVNTNFVPIQQLNLDTLYASFGKSTQTQCTYSLKTSQIQMFCTRCSYKMLKYKPNTRCSYKMLVQPQILASCFIPIYRPLIFLEKS